MKNKYLTLASKNLSNNFLGGQNMGSVETLVTAISNKFGMTITSTSATPRVIALLPSYYKTLGTKDIGTSTDPNWTPHYHNKQALIDAGIFVDAIVDDDTWTFDGDTGNLTIYSVDPNKKIRDFLEYIKSYPHLIVGMTIHSPNIKTYEGILKLQRPNPFNDSARVPVDLNQYFKTNQYQDNKIDIDLSGISLELTPDLLLLMTIPASTTVTVDFFLRAIEF